MELLPLTRPIRELGFVVDVGANSGRWCTALSSLISLEKLIAFEPLPSVFQELELNTREYPRIQCIQSAIGASCGTVKMHVESVSELSSVLPMTSQGRGYHQIDSSWIPKVIEVPLTTLDEALKEIDSIDLLKVDVQGYESAVFAGASSILQRTAILLIEIMYAPYYEGALGFHDLLKKINEIAPFKLWAVSCPHFSGTGEPVWADVVLVKA